MNVELVNAEDVFQDDNNGLVFGLQEVDEDGYYMDYIEWFETEAERDKTITEYDMDVMMR